MWFRKFLVSAFFAVIAVSPAFSAVDYQIEDQAVVLEKAHRLEHKGILKQKDNGYLYVEVSKDFIAQILPLLKAPGKLDPPKHYKSKKGIGAHISVMYENERIDREIWTIHELGQEFSFSILELRTVKLTRDNKMKKLWLLAVSCPELEALRERYGLSPRLKGHDFHITLCTQVPGQPAVIEIELDDAA
ncbi:MAG TPA: hypothetical protein VGO47_03010 [Chlamydiales bacterium]|jgi:hypothetical protein|nr:hypothetical protein [Chlamydiales bacterium]